MATFFSGATIGYWNTQNNYISGILTGTVSRAGNTVTLSNMVLKMDAIYNSTGSDSFTFTVSGVSTTFTVYANGTTNLGSYNLLNASFSVSPSQTSSTVYWSSSDGYSGSFSVSFPSGYVAPTTPTVMATATSPTSVSITYGTTSFGTPATGNIVLKYGTTSSTINTTLDTQNTTGNHTFTHTGLTPNTTYYYKATATNTQSLSTSSAAKNVTTPKPPMYGSVNKQTKTVVKFYGSVNNLSKNVVKYYGSVNGKTKQIF